MTHEAPSLLELTRGRWYALQLHGSELSPSDGFGFSPILVHDVRPLGTGRGLLELSFHHENYPSGVQHKEYRLQVLARDRFLFARRIDAKPVRYLMIQELTWPWLEKHFGFRGHEGDDVQRWRERSGLMD